MAEAIHISAWQSGRRLNVREPRPVADKAVALLLSCSVNSTNAVKVDVEADKAMRMSSFVRVRFEPPRALRLPTSDNRGKKPIAVGAILVPLPSPGAPDHIFVETPKGKLAFTKYAPEALMKLQSSLLAT